MLQRCGSCSRFREKVVDRGSFRQEDPPAADKRQVNSVSSRFGEWETEEARQQGKIKDRRPSGITDILMQGKEVSSKQASAPFGVLHDCGSHTQKLTLYSLCNKLITRILICFS